MKRCIVFFFLLPFSFFISALSRLPYPEIEDLNTKDVFFNQYSTAVSNARKAIAQLDTSVDITPEFYTYTVKAGETLLEIAVRCCIPYDAIVTLNRISSIEESIEGMRLLLPSLPALYVYAIRESSFEHLVAAFVDKVPSYFEGFEIAVFYDLSNFEHVYCLPNALFDGTIRSLFFLPYYQYPLDSRRVTSEFGLRKDPFTGQDSHHSGIDIAAPLGTTVRAIAGGTVVKTGYDNILGNYIIIAHTDGRESVYGHLSSIFVGQNDTVKSGTHIGTVGSTGRSTGNHLHLEIREQHTPVNPRTFLKD